MSISGVLHRLPDGNSGCAPGTRFKRRLGRPTVRTLPASPVRPAAYLGWPAVSGKGRTSQLRAGEVRTMAEEAERSPHLRVKMAQSELSLSTKPRT